MACQYNFYHIYNAIKARLINNATVSTYKYNTTTVKLVARPELTPVLTGERDVLIRFTKPYPTEGFHQGAGRLCSEVARYVEVIPRTRLQTGQSDRDDNVLMNASLGHMLSEEFVCDALHLRELWREYNSQDEAWEYPLTPTAESDRLLTEPMRLIEGPYPFATEVSPVSKWDEENPPHTKSSLLFEVKYALLLETT